MTQNQLSKNSGYPDSRLKGGDKKVTGFLYDKLISEHCGGKMRDQVLGKFLRI